LFKLGGVVQYSCPKPRNIENPLPVKFKMADGAQIGYIAMAITHRRLFDFAHIWYIVWTRDSGDSRPLHYKRSTSRVKGQGRRRT